MIQANGLEFSYWRESGEKDENFRNTRIACHPHLPFKKYPQKTQFAVFASHGNAIFSSNIYLMYDLHKSKSYPFALHPTELLGFDEVCIEKFGFQFSINNDVIEYENRLYSINPTYLKAMWLRCKTGVS